MSSSPEAAMAQVVNPNPPCPRKSGRPPNEAYIKLMKPDEDWRATADGAERRRLQNRLAQRAYRRNLRERNKELEKLKSKVRALENGNGHRERSTSVSTCGSVGQNRERDKSLSRTSSRRSHHSPEAMSRSDQSLTSSDLNYVIPDVFTDMDVLDPDGLLGLYFEGSKDGGSSSVSGYDDTNVELSNHAPATPPYSGNATRLCSSPSTNPDLRSETSGLLPSSLHISSTALLMDLPDLMTDMSGGDLGSMVAQSMTTTPPNSMEQTFTPPFTATPSLPLPQSSKTDPRFQGASGLSSWLPDANASLLHFAVCGARIDTLKLLLQHQPCALDVQDSEGYTPIQRAIMLGRSEMVALLLRYGAR